MAYALAAGLFVVCALVASRIKIEEDISRAMPQSGRAQKINSILSQTAFTDRIVVKIHADSTASAEDLIARAQLLEESIQKNYPEGVAEIKSRIDDDAFLKVYETVNGNIPIYLTENDYKRIDTLITPEHISLAIASDYKLLTSASGIVMKKIIANDPVGISGNAFKKLQSLQVDDVYELYDGYILTTDHRNLVMFIRSAYPPGETAKNQKLADKLKEIVQGLNQAAPNTPIYYYGATVAAVSNASRLKKDTALTLSITIVALLLFIFFFFRKASAPIILMLPVIFGGVFAIAFIAIVKGSISSIALAAGSIVLGIAVNYSLHFFSHYKHCGSVSETLNDLFEPLTTGSFTTIGSFFSLLLVKSAILADFGLFAGMSLTGATIFTLIFLPHFVPEYTSVTGVKDRTVEDKPSLPLKYIFVPFLLVVGLTVFFFPHALRVSFESDMNSLNFLTPDLKKSEAEINALQTISSKTVFIASTGSGIQQALENNEMLLASLDSFQNTGLVKRVASISYFMPSEKLQRERIARWNAYWTPEKKEALLTALQREGAKFKFTPAAFNNFRQKLEKQYQPLTEEELSSVKTALGANFILSSAHLNSVINTVKVDLDQRPALYRALEQNPNTVVLDKQVVTQRFIDTIYNDFNSILFYTSALVFIALLLSYGRLELTLLTFLPMVISWIWILGITSLAGIKFNIVSIIISTFIFGLGDDFSIFFTDGLTQKFKTGKNILQSHRTSIFLSAATTMIGMGTLILAVHPAMRSVAITSIIGIFCVLLVGLIVQPFLYRLFILNRKAKGFAPWTIPTLALTIFSFSFFVVGSLVLTVLGVLLLYVLPFPSKVKRKRAYHFLISNFCKALVYTMANVKRSFINKSDAIFEKPSVIIANHQGFLDILFVVLQHPKLILVTNRWVYYSPVFGKVVQMADYYPVMEGVEPAIDKFEEIAAQGYSIVIFPEGTRSPDGKIGRFHKGAFYLAEKLKMDITPLLFHGTGDSIRKGDFMLFNGTVTMKYLPRITPDNKEFGEGYAERTKNISRYFKQAYAELKEQAEDGRYFKQKLLSNYSYKGPMLEFYPGMKLRSCGYYNSLNALLPKTGTITVVGADYGILSYMLYFREHGRTILTVDENEEQTTVADNCYSKNSNLTFTCAPLLEHEFSVTDAYVLNNAEGEYGFDKAAEVLKRLAKGMNRNAAIFVISDKLQAELSANWLNLAKQLNLQYKRFELGYKLYVGGDATD